jgi:hypothetical protein
MNILAGHGSLQVAADAEQGGGGYDPLGAIPYLSDDEGVGLELLQLHLKSATTLSVLEDKTTLT